jgi:hypothetical protein
MVRLTINYLDQVMCCEIASPLKQNATRISRHAHHALSGVNMTSYRLCKRIRKLLTYHVGKNKEARKDDLSHLLKYALSKVVRTGGFWMHANCPRCTRYLPRIPLAALNAMNVVLSVRSI